METTQPVQASGVMDAQPVKHALCIKREHAPADILAITEGTHFVSIPQGFFDTPVELQDRATCETDPNYLQLLPYVMIMDGDGKVFRYFRGKGGAEDRLHGKISVGVGGHMDHMPSGDLLDEVRKEAAREIAEEINIVMKPRAINIEGFLYNPTGVNQVHLGILCTVIVANSVADMLMEEGVIEDGAFVHRHDLLPDEMYERLEDWSKIAVWWSLTRERRAPK